MLISGGDSCDDLFLGLEAPPGIAVGVGLSGPIDGAHRPVVGLIVAQAGQFSFEGCARADPASVAGVIVGIVDAVLIFGGLAAGRPG